MYYIKREFQEGIIRLRFECAAATFFTAKMIKKISREKKGDELKVLEKYKDKRDSFASYE